MYEFCFPTWLFSYFFVIMIHSARSLFYAHFIKLFHFFSLSLFRHCFSTFIQLLCFLSTFSHSKNDWKCPGRFGYQSSKVGGRELQFIFHVWLGKYLHSAGLISLDQHIWEKFPVLLCKVAPISSAYPPRLAHKPFQPYKSFEYQQVLLFWSFKSRPKWRFHQNVNSLTVVQLRLN